jgi:hypothetical protein
MSTGSLASRAPSPLPAAKALAAGNQAFYAQAIPLLKKRLAEMYEVEEADEDAYFKFGDKLKHADTKEPTISLTVSVEIPDKAARGEKARIRADEEILKLLEYKLEESWEVKTEKEAKEEPKAEEVKDVVKEDETEVAGDKEVEEEDQVNMKAKDETKDETKADGDNDTEKADGEEKDERQKALKREKQRESIVEFYLDIAWDVCYFGPV